MDLEVCRVCEKNPPFQRNPPVIYMAFGCLQDLGVEVYAYCRDHAGKMFGHYLHGDLWFYCPNQDPNREELGHHRASEMHATWINTGERVTTGEIWP